MSIIAGPVHAAGSPPPAAGCATLTGDYRANCEQRNARRGAVVTGVVVGRTARMIAA